MPQVKSPLHLGAVLRSTRTAAKLTASDVAAMAGTSAVTLRRLEQGNATAGLQTLFKVLDELGIQLHLDLPPGMKTIDLPEPADKPKRTRVQR